MHQCCASEVEGFVNGRIMEFSRAHALPLIVRYMFIKRVIMSHKLVNRVTMFGSCESILFGRLHAGAGCAIT